MKEIVFIQLVVLDMKGMQYLQNISYTDLALLHYRSSAFFIERSKQIYGMTPIYDLGLSFVASSDDPISEVVIK